MEIHDQVPGGLGHPRGGRVRGRAEHPDPASVVPGHREHEHPRPRQGGRLEEVARQQGLCLGAQEAGPGRGRAPGLRIDPGFPQDLPHRGGSHLHPEHEQLTVHPPVPPPGVLPDQAQDQGTDGAHGAGPAWPPGPRPGSMSLPDQVAVPAQHRAGVYQQPHPAKGLWPQPVQQRRQQRPVRRREAHLLPAQLALQYRDLMAEDQNLGVFVPIAHGKEDAAPRTRSPQSSRPVATAQSHIMPRRPPRRSRSHPVQGDGSSNLGLADVMHLTCTDAVFSTHGVAEVCC
jgi:hypothetical protein